MKTLIATSILIIFFSGKTFARDLMIIDGDVETLQLVNTIGAIGDEVLLINKDSVDKDQVNGGIEIEETDSTTTTIRLRNRSIIIIEKNGSTSIEIPKSRDVAQVSQPRFKGHWSGFEWGFNGFMTPNGSINMRDDNKFLELRQGRSWNINLNFLQYSLGFGSDKIGLVTGLGLEFNDYHFRNPTTLKVVDGITVKDESYFLNQNINVTKTKLTTINLTAPLLMEFQIPTSSDKHRIFFSAGVIGGVRIKSHTKIVYDGASKGKDKERSDFNQSTFRYGLTTRIGYRGLKFFANYYPTPLFENGKGPEIYPFSVGLVLLSFR